jgi:hypothetical protein
MPVVEEVAPPPAGAPRTWRRNPGSSVVLPLGEKLRWILGIWGVCFAYAIVRYNLLKGVEWSHLPLYVTNKSFAWAGLAFVAASYLTGKWIRSYPNDPHRRRAQAKFLGMSGFYFIGVHVFASLAMLSPVYYEKFYATGGKLNTTGELTILFGVLGLGFLMFPAVTTLPLMYEALGPERWKRAQRMGYWAIAMGCAHTFTMGYAGWIDVASWPGGLPPITLWGFLAGASALAAKAWDSRRARG